MPNIFVLSRPVFTESYNNFLKDVLPAEEAWWREAPGVTSAERLVEFAGRVCYLSFGSAQSPRTNAEYIENLIRSGHESVLEHAVWSFALTGVSRAFTHQLVRHRVGFSFSQLSQQYHNEADARFVRPVELGSSPEASAIWEEAIEKTREAYRELYKKLDSLEGKNLSKEGRRSLRSTARSVLPNATETLIVVTANARAIRHFLKLRGEIQGDLEMRNVSSLLLKTLKPDAPALFSDFRIEYLNDGNPIVRHAEFPSGAKDIY